MTEGYNRNYDFCASNEKELVEVDENISNVNGLPYSRESRKRRVSITKEKLREFIHLYELNYKNMRIQAALNLSYSTVERRYYQGEFNNIEAFKSFAEKKKVSEKNYRDERDIIARAFVINNFLTQKELYEELVRNGYNVSLPKVCRILKTMNYTRKRLVMIPIERNCQRIIEQRTEFCMYVEHILDDNLICLDEFGVNGHCVCSYGYSPKNSKAVTSLNANRGRNVSALVAISKNGIICVNGW